MTAEEYWKGNPWLAKSYREAWKLKQDEVNFEAWLYGLYTYKAIGVVLGNAFRKRGTQADNYFDKPVNLGEEEEKTPEQIRKETIERLKTIEKRWNNARTN